MDNNIQLNFYFHCNTYVATIQVFDCQYFMLTAACKAPSQFSSFGQAVESISCGPSKLTQLEFQKVVQESQNESLEYEDNMSLLFAQWAVQVLNQSDQSEKINHYVAQNQANQQARLLEVIKGVNADKSVIKLTRLQEQLLSDFLGGVLNKYQKQENTCQEDYVKKKGESKVKEIQSLGELVSLTTQFPKVLLECYAEWCQPCFALKPHLDKLSLEMHSVQFASVDVDEVKEVQKHLDIKMLPQFFCYVNGAVQKQWTGEDENELNAQAILLGSK